jgi:hypothetical protein
MIMVMMMMLQTSNELVRPRRARRLMDSKPKRNRCGSVNKNQTQEKQKCPKVSKIINNEVEQLETPKREYKSCPR